MRLLAQWSNKHRVEICHSWALQSGDSSTPYLMKWKSHNLTAILRPSFWPAFWPGIPIFASVDLFYITWPRLGIWHISQLNFYRAKKICTKLCTSLIDFHDTPAICGLLGDAEIERFHVFVVSILRLRQMCCQSSRIESNVLSILSWLR